MSTSMVVFKGVERIEGSTIDQFRYTFEVELHGFFATFIITEKTKGGDPDIQAARQRLLQNAKTISETSSAPLE